MSTPMLSARGARGSWMSARRLVAVPLAAAQVLFLLGPLSWTLVLLGLGIGLARRDLRRPAAAALVAFVLAVGAALAWSGLSVGGLGVGARASSSDLHKVGLALALIAPGLAAALYLTLAATRWRRWLAGGSLALAGVAMALYGVALLADAKRVPAALAPQDAVVTTLLLAAFVLALLATGIEAVAPSRT